MLEVRDLHVSYGRIRAVQGVSLAVRAGEVVALVGANGAGKSSILKAIAGLERPERGTIRFEGADIAGAPAHRTLARGIAYVPEGRMIVGTLSVRDNLRLGAYARLHAGTGGGADLAAEIARVLATFPDLRGRLDEPGASLSGGQAQMLALARGLMAAPKLLLLDEPSLGLAPVMTRAVFDLLARLKAEGATILLVEQNVAEALALADRAYVLESGRVVKQGAASLLARDPGLREAYLGVRPEPQP
jgi:ABC-type branched-subunit amino acid transport system ATPase component